MSLVFPDYTPEFMRKKAHQAPRVLSAIEDALRQILEEAEWGRTNAMVKIRGPYLGGTERITGELVRRGFKITGSDREVDSKDAADGVVLYVFLNWE